jgi:hypothetical protein
MLIGRSGLNTANWRDKCERCEGVTSGCWCGAHLLLREVFEEGGDVGGRLIPESCYLILGICYFAQRQSA